MKKKYLVRSQVTGFQKQKTWCFSFVCKMFFLNKKLPYLVRLFSFFLLNMFQTHVPMGQVLHRCLVTGRANGVYRVFGLSRLEIRRQGSSGLIPGLRKDSW